MTGETTFSDGEGREIARIEVERVESRDGALHVTGRVVPPADEVLEGEIVDAGSGVHYPHCNSARCTGCIPQEVVDDCGPLGEHLHRLLADALHGFGPFADRVIVTSVQRSNDTVGVGFTVDPPARGHRAAYMTIDEAVRWAAGDTSYAEARRQWLAQYRYGELGLTAKDLRVPHSGA